MRRDHGVQAVPSRTLLNRGRHVVISVLYISGRELVFPLVPKMAGVVFPSPMWSKTKRSSIGDLGAPRPDASEIVADLEEHAV